MSHESETVRNTGKYACTHTLSFSLFSPPSHTRNQIEKGVMSRGRQAGNLRKGIEWGRRPYWRLGEDTIARQTIKVDRQTQ